MISLGPKVSVFALLHGLSFGRDFVFTSGPLSPIYTGLFSENYTLPISLVSLFDGGVSRGSCSEHPGAAVDAESRLGFFLLAATIIVLAYPTGRDSLLLLIPVLTALLYANRIGGPVIILPGIALSAAVSLAKFSVFPLAIGAFVLIDFLSVARRDWPYKTICLLLTASILFAATGQDLADFPAYILANIEFSSGYSAAMSVDPPQWGRLLLIAWFALAALLLVLVVIGEWRMCRLDISDRPTGLTRVLLLAGFLFILVKAAFVRHDLHTLIGWSGLALAGLVFQRFAPVASPSDRRLAACIACIAIMATAGGVSTLAVTSSKFLPACTGPGIPDLVASVEGRCKNCSRSSNLAG